MSRSIPLIAAIVGVAAAACSRDDGPRQAPVAVRSAPVAAPVYQVPATAYPYENTSYSAPAVSYPAAVAAEPIYAAPALPASRPAVIAQPVETAAYVPPAITPLRATPLPASRITPQPRDVASVRPPARTALERLNPGMPRLVEAEPKPPAGIARPRSKPARPGQRVAEVAPRASSGSFAIPSTTGAVGYTSSMSTPPAIEYQIPHIPQEEPLWCWAAAAQQAIGWVNNGRAPAQCAIVALAHGIDVQTCCNDREGVCAKTGEIPAIAALVRRFGGQAAESATVPRDPKEIYRILQGGSTLLIRLRPAPHDQAVGIRHMIVVRGIEWLRLPNGRLEATLLYNDPLGAGYRAVSFSEIVGFFEQALIVRRST